VTKVKALYFAFAKYKAIGGALCAGPEGLKTPTLTEHSEVRRFALEIKIKCFQKNVKQ